MPTAYAEGSRPSRIGWELPAFYCPFERGLIHPEAAAVEKRAVDWIDAYGIYPDATERAWGLATNSAEFTSRIIPHGAVEPMVLFTEWNYWAFSTDDWQDSETGPAGTATVADHGARMIRTIEAPGTGLLPPGPQTAALEDLAARTRAMLTPVQLRRFVEAVREWVLGATWQAASAGRTAMPGLNEFVAKRIASNGTRFTLSWCDVANGIAVPGEELYTAPVQALTDAAGFIVSCDNDLFSYNKDDHQVPWEQNLVNVLAARDGCTPAEALPAAYALRDRAVTLFQRLREQIGRDAGEQLGRYLLSLEHWLAGDLEYHVGAPRYASPRNRNALPVDGARFDISWRDTPSDPSTDAPPVPAIAWWWQQLDGARR
ncbi:terpene synthase family protein [Streptomyces sp. cmx-4-9]|uniref:terpene synthase family protein n=1 Tax=Streptomyces sp. cmx-4-9 TaxID=2790941 RepID=UPI003981187B